MIVAGILACACLLAPVLVAIDNAGLPKKSPIVETLSPADKIRLAEASHLRRELGNSIWPPHGSVDGFGEVEIPYIQYNEEYAFLVGLENPARGWVKVPAGIQRGTDWETVTGDSIQENMYYRQRLDPSGVTPEAFTVKVGGRWAASLATVDWSRIELAAQISQDLPEFLRPVFPYRFFLNQLISGDDQYISLIIHEAFHAYQGGQAPQKFAAAENASDLLSNRYPWTGAGWVDELNTLVLALKASDESQVLLHTREFLRIRNARRQAAALSPDLIGYEQKREWLEGLARYTELEIWRLASTSSYTPDTSTTGLRAFNRYQGFGTRWERELGQFSRMADDVGDGRFYYSGMAQAVLLDRLDPDWKQQVFSEDIWLDDLLGQAVNAAK